MIIGYQIINKCFPFSRQFIRHCYLAVILFAPSAVNAQSCSPDIFFQRYSGNAAIYVSGSITTIQNETVVAGATLNFNGVFNNATDGWITKLSARGTILWAKQYYMPGFNSGGFSCIQNATDSTYFVTGRFGFYIKNAGSQIEEVNASTFLFHLDKFGNPIWIKRITNFITNSSLGGITKINNNSFIVSGTVYSNGTSRLLLMGMDLNGNVSWSRVIRQENTQLAQPYPLLLTSGELLLMGTVMKSVEPGQYSNQGYYYLTIDVTDGYIISNKAIYIGEAPDPYIPVHGIKKIHQAGNSLYLYASFSERTPFNPVPYAREAAIIEIGINGSFSKAVAFYNDVPGCEMLDGIYNDDGTHTLLLDDGYKTIRTRVKENGDIIHQNAYPLVNGNMKGLKLLDRIPANRILFAGRTQVPLIGLMKTESEGRIHCMEGPPRMTSLDVSSYFKAGNLNLVFFNTNPVIFEPFNGGIGRKTYPFNQITDCFESCCNNIRSDTTYTELCNAAQYRLPDNSLIKESGLYYTTYTTPNDCDSIAYHKVLFTGKPVVNLGLDGCFGNNSTVTLKVDSGYSQYNWMGNISSNHYFTITSPGIYTVSVTNTCGTGTDKIEIFQECEFPVYIPSGFTPNNDGLNDKFGYPSRNKNRFVSMSVYNRWGQRIYYSTDPAAGWDGTYKKLEQPGDVYTYAFQLLTLDGRPLFTKGIVTLIK